MSRIFSSPLLLIASLAIFSLIHLSFQQQCAVIDTPEGPIDISGLSSKEYSVTGEKGWTYHAKVCGSFSNFGPCTFTQSGISSYQVYSDESLCHFLGTYNAKTTVALTDPSNPKGGVTLKYADGEFSTGLDRSTQIDLVCDETDSGAFTCVGNCEEESAARVNYHFSLKTKSACPGGGGGEEGGRPPLWPVGILGLLSILFAIGIQLYWPIGLIVNKFVRKKEGIEIIPNVHFWKDLPFLLKDGFLFVFKDIMYDKIISKIVAKIRGGRGGASYEEA